jgi:hypothetical protein
VPRPTYSRALLDFQTQTEGVGHAFVQPWRVVLASTSLLEAKRCRAVLAVVNHLRHKLTTTGSVRFTRSRAASPPASQSSPLRTTSGSSAFPARDDARNVEPRTCERPDRRLSVDDTRCPLKGASFVVTLPLRAVRSAQETRARRPPVNATTIRSTTRPPCGVRTLLVDDDEDSLDRLREVRGLKLTHAEDGRCHDLRRGSSGSADGRPPRLSEN